MPNRRSFLQTLSGLPVVGGLLVSPTATARSAAPGRAYFRELGVRPFTNAAGTYTVPTARPLWPGRARGPAPGVRPCISAAGAYTVLTASLMQPEVVEAIEYASRRYVPLNDLHD